MLLIRSHRDALAVSARCVCHKAGNHICKQFQASDAERRLKLPCFNIFRSDKDEM